MNAEDTIVLWLLEELFMPLEELVSKRIKSALQTYLQLFKIPTF